MVLPLEGMKILDLSRLAPGPYCTMLLGDMGADVLLIEEAGTPSGRRAAQAAQGPQGADDPNAARRVAAGNSLGRNKRSLRLNLKKDEAREIFYKLVDEADVVLEGFRPGVVKRLGVDYETLSARNPRIICCSLSGFGQDGPYAMNVGHDINYISIGGALGMIGSEGPGKRPAIPVNIIADFAGGGLMAAFAILCAVQARERTGKGQNIDVAMSDGVMSLISSMAAMHFASGQEIAPRDSMLNGAVPHYNVYECADGRWFSVGALEPWFYANLCTVMGREDFIEHQAMSDAAKAAEISAHFTAQFKTKTADEWFRLLNEVDVCAAPVLSLSEAFEDPHNIARKMVLEVDVPGGGTVRQVGIAPKLSDTPGEVRGPAPTPGLHTDDVLGELGFDAAAITKLREGEVVA